MSEEVYAQYLDGAVRAYAKENVESGRWPDEGAIKRSEIDFNNLLPQ